MQALTKCWTNSWVSIDLRCHKAYVYGLVQERCNPIANALELRLSCTNPSMWWRCSHDELILPQIVQPLAHCGMVTDTSSWVEIRGRHECGERILWHPGKGFTSLLLGNCFTFNVYDLLYFQCSKCQADLTYHWLFCMMHHHMVMLPMADSPHKGSVMQSFDVCCC